MLVVPHSPQWATDYTVEAEAIAGALQDTLLALHHIGSTAIPGIHAKPVIDMLAVVERLEVLDAHAPAIAGLGYQVMGEFGIAGRRYFRKDNAAGVRTHHLHGFAQGSSHIARHLAFRDYLRAHPTIAQEYSALKQQLATDPAGYVEGKAPFVLATQADALAWFRRQQTY